MFIIIDVSNDKILLFCSLNNEKRHRDEEQHKSEIERLQKQINHVRTSYPSKAFLQEYAKQQNLKQRISKFPMNYK